MSKRFLKNTLSNLELKTYSHLKMRQTLDLIGKEANLQADI